ncbi:MAG: hypothetical protein ABSD42_02615 [Candidatus Bathyarchaeia archaeon]
MPKTLSFTLGNLPIMFISIVERSENDLGKLLRDSIIRVVNDYMKLWAFIQKTNGARETFSGKFKRRIG